MAHSNRPDRNVIDPDDVQVMYTWESPLVGTYFYTEDNTVSAWHAKIAFKAPSSNDEPVPIIIGSIRGFLVDLDAGEDVWSALDAVSGDLETLGSALLVSPSILEIAEMFPSHLILIDHVHLNPDFRGTSLGPRAVATALQTFGQGRQAIAALIAQPEDWLDQDPKVLPMSQSKVRAAWESIGFQLFKSNIMWLDATDYNGSDFFAT